MDIEKVFAVLNARFRRRRFELFSSTIRPGLSDRVLDVGGRPSTWTAHPPVAAAIDVLNVDSEPVAVADEHWSARGISLVVGDARQLHYDDDSFDIVFSNSVIEHVGSYDDQRAFAHEVRRVGRRLWIQTPARCFPIEPHYIAPFVHWLPRRWQRHLVTPDTQRFEPRGDCDLQARRTRRAGHPRCEPADGVQ